MGRGQRPEDESHVGPEAKERVVAAGLGDRHDAVGQAPEEHRHHHAAPQLRHHVKERKGPAPTPPRRMCTDATGVEQKCVPRGEG